MTERIKQCDVVESCVDCPRYGDDCDGDKRIEPTYLISRAEVHKTLSLLAIEGGTDAKMLLSDAHEFIDALPSADAVSREECDECKTDKEGVLLQQLAELQGDYETMKNAYEDALADAEWIPCSERLPEDIKPVIVTWKNTDPRSYYQHIVGKHFIGTAHYMNGKWFWYSSVTEDLLAEYGRCDGEEFDEAIEVVAWMPLPKPWKAR